MKRQKDGSWRTTVDLATDGEYQFRYLIDGRQWLNDPEADGYTPNPYGDQNSIVTT
jgi:1,4-alpha-glucan branching enzyme